MAAWGVLSIAFGLISMLFPGAIGSLGEETTNTFLLGSWGWLTAILGLGVLFASRDPVRHILWLRIAILSFVIGGTYDIAHVMADTVSFGSVLIDLAAYSIFGMLFVVLYPRAPRWMALDVRTPRGPLFTDADKGGVFFRDEETGVFAPFSPPDPDRPASSPYLPPRSEPFPSSRPLRPPHLGPGPTTVEPGRSSPPLRNEPPPDTLRRAPSPRPNIFEPPPGRFPRSGIHEPTAEESRKEDEE